MNAGGPSVADGLLFRRIADLPFGICAAALDSWLRTGQDGELRIGRSLLRRPAEQVRESPSLRLEVRLGRGRLRPPLTMRLDIDPWTGPPARTVFELTPDRRARPTASYFRAGHLLLSSLIHALSQHAAASPGQVTRPGGPAPEVAAPGPLPPGMRPGQLARRLTGDR